MPTALNLYFNSAAATTLPNANILSLGTSGTKVTETVGTGIGIGEMASRGSGSWAGAFSLPSPTGNGWILDSTSMEGQRLATGNWAAFITVQGNTPGSPQIGMRFYCRVYKRSSDGTFTNIITLGPSNAYTMGIPTTLVQLLGTTSSTVDFQTGDKIYVDVFGEVSVVGQSSSVVYFYENQGSSAYVATPGYDLIPFYSISGTINAKKPTFPSSSIVIIETVSGTVAARKPIVSGALIERYNVGGTIAARKPTLTGGLVSAMVLNGAINAKKPTVSGVLDTRVHITPSNLAPFPVGGFFSQQLTSQGGVQPITWEIADPALPGERLPGESALPPTGITLSSSGLLSGTSSESGTYTVYVRAIDAVGSIDTARFLLNVSNDSFIVGTGVAKRPTVTGTVLEQFVLSGTVAAKRPSTSSTISEQFVITGTAAARKPSVKGGQTPVINGTIRAKKPSVTGSELVFLQPPTTTGLRFVQTPRVGIYQQ